MNAIPSLTLSCAIALGLCIVAPAMAVEPAVRETMSERIADARHEAQILTSFSMNRHLRDYAFTVSVNGTRASIGGNVEDEVAKDLAGHIARRVDGITEVDNDIVVDAGYIRTTSAETTRRFGDTIDDATIDASIKYKMLWNSRTDGLDIHVASDNGRVRLSGTAGSDAERNLAVRIARDTAGVTSVDNQIALNGKTGTPAEPRSGTSPNGPMTDSWITSKVKSSLVFTRGVNGFAITVTTLNGTVSLQGVVDSAAERELAVRVTRDIRGVLKVDAQGLKVG